MSATQDKAKPRSVPETHFTDAEAGAITFPGSDSRNYNYYKPQKAKASLYEDVTVDVQPDPTRHLTQGWVYAFANGQSGYPPEWTSLVSSDWHAFRDPNQEWEKTIYNNNSNIVRQISQNLENARSQHAFKTWNPAWVKLVAKHVGAWMHVEQGMGMHIFVPAQRDAPTNMINNAIAVNSVHKLRFAQDLALYNLELSEEIEGFDGKAHLQAWKEDPIWQGVRENVEIITAIHDWAEAVFVANIIFLPLVNELFRSNFVMQVAAPNGDYVTPGLMGAGENDDERDLRYTTVLFEMLANDATHGAQNKATMTRWLEKYTPLSLKAARALQPIWSQPMIKPVKFEDSLDLSKQRYVAILKTLDLPVPKELSA
ncbi:MAG: toluene hydroxylase [Vulcanimicrobiaceae bacterium]